MRFLLILSVFLTGSLFAQIPNSDFESWVPAPWYQNPEGWTTPNDEVNFVVSQDNDAFEGDYAMRVDAIPVPLGALGWAECTVPIDYIPSSLDFYVKAGTEFGGVSVTISFYNNEFLFNSFDWNSGTPIEEWTFISIPLDQYEPVLTHAVIRVEAQVGDLVPGTAWISVDAMGFESTLSDEEVTVEGDIQIYPNPCSDYIILDGISANSTVRILNVAGQTVFESNPTISQMRLDIQNFPKGLYILNVQTANQVSNSQKLVIE